MILVTTGTNAPAFDRLLQEVEAMDIDEAVVVQHGPSALRPAGATCVDYVSFDRFVELVREARIVVTHAGVGSILVTLMNGKRPFVVPRLARFGEHVDDHQLELGRRLSEIGVVELIEDPSQTRERDPVGLLVMAALRPPGVADPDDSPTILPHTSIRSSAAEPTTGESSPKPAGRRWHQGCLA